MMVPTQEFERLQDYYKGQILQSALLNKAGRLAAEKHLILSNRKIPDATAVRMTKPLAREQARLTKRIRTGTRIPAGAGMPSEAMVDSPLENLLKKIIEKEVPAAAAAAPAGAAATPATPIIKKEPVAGPSGLKIKKESKSVKPPIPPKPFVSAKKPKSTGGITKAAFSGATKALLRQAGFDDKFIDSDTDDDKDEGGYSPKKKAKKKAKKTALQKLQEGWEEWDKPSRGPLGYDSD